MEAGATPPQPGGADAGGGAGTAVPILHGEPGAAPPEEAAAATAGVEAPCHDHHLEEVEITAVDVACVAPIVLSWLWGFFGQPISPLLINSHPVVLAGLRGSTAAMIVCGAGVHVGHIPLWEAMLAPLPVLTIADPFLYWAGRRYGRAIFDYYASLSDAMRRTIARGEAVFARYGFWAILFSAFLPLAVLFFVAAGESRMRLWKFAVADILSNLIWIGLIVALGWALGNRGLEVADAIGHYGLLISVVLMVVVVIAFVRQYRKAQRMLADREANRTP